MSVGNDVVDLADPEARLEGLHPRFEQRVFGARERELLRTSGSRQALHWAFWAAKESAYKALKRHTPELVFAPREFAVELSGWPPPDAGGVAAGWVLHRGRRLDLAVRCDRESVHAVASLGGGAAELLWKAGRAGGDPGVAVRRLAAAAIGRAWGLAPAGVLIVRRPPLATHPGRGLAAELSLSHHGRFVAFACALAGSATSACCPGAPGS